jgi:hypothetical protein
VWGKWRWVVCFALRPLYPQGQTRRYPLEKGLGGHQSRSVNGGEEKNPCLCTESNPGLLARSPVTIMTELTGSYLFTIQKWTLLCDFKITHPHWVFTVKMYAYEIICYISVLHGYAIQYSYAFPILRVAVIDPKIPRPFPHHLAARTINTRKSGKRKC